MNTNVSFILLKKNIYLSSNRVNEVILLLNHSQIKLILVALRNVVNQLQTPDLRFVELGQNKVAYQTSAIGNCCYWYIIDI